MIILAYLRALRADERPMIWKETRTYISFAEYDDVVDEGSRRTCGRTTGGTRRCGLRVIFVLGVGEKYTGGLTETATCVGKEKGNGAAK